MIVGNNYIFVHIPRTSGSSIEHVLQYQHGGKEVNSIHYAFCDDSSRLPCLTNRTVFTFVRNPFEREFSQWNYHTDKPEFIKKPSFNQWVNWRYNNYNLPKKYISKERREYGYLKTFSLLPMVGYFIDQNLNLKIDFIGNFENRDEDTKYIFKKLGINQDWSKFPHEEGSRTGIPSSEYPNYYDSESKALIESAYDVDLKAFGYSFEKRESEYPNSIDLSFIDNYDFIENIGIEGYNYKGI